MIQIYKAFLRLYPREYSEYFAAEMLSVFEEVIAETRRQGSATFVRCVLIELCSVIRGACAEWIAKTAHSVYHSSSYIGNGCLPDRHLMRPAGIARELYFVNQTPTTLKKTCDDGMCVNVYQRFAFASSPKRLLILASLCVLPLHSSRRG